MKTMKSNDIFWGKIKHLWMKYNQSFKLYTKEELQKMLDSIIYNSKK